MPLPRNRKVIFDHLYPVPSHQFNISLLGLIPQEVHDPAFRGQLTTQEVHDSAFRGQLTAHWKPLAPALHTPLPVGHHLVYFGPQIPRNGLMPDGTDIDHCPGAPFTRRMWAGGSLRFPLKGGAWGQATQEAFRLDGRSALCLETMGERPTTKGYEHVDKIFVEHRRQYGLGRVNSMGRHLDYVDRNPIIDETRTLVFMRERGDVAEEMIRAGATNRFSAQAPVQDKQRDMTRLKALKDKYMVPTYSFKLTPDRRLLFQFSALSFNAHAIHIDPRYAQEVEGYKDLLVHGPLSLALMLMAVRTQAEVLNAKAGKGLRVSLMEFHYRNLAPLYVGEEMKVCVRVPEAGGDWDVWIEGPDGGFAVKGTATMGPLGKADRRILHKERKKLAKKTPSNDGSPNDPEGLVDKAIVLGVIGS